MNSGSSRSKPLQRNERRGRALAWATLIVASVAGAREPVAITPQELSTDQYEASPAFTPDGREVFYMLADPAFARYRLMWSRCESGRWSAPRPPEFAAAPEIFEGDPFLTPDGSQLYFISAREGDKKDDFDIWVVARESDGGYRKARRLPDPVNSPNVELLPRVTGDRRIYFGSDRPGGHGQMDIYIASPAADGAWSVVNAGPPLSTAASEYEAEVSRDERTIVVVADRGDRSHLYRFAKQAGRWVEIERIAARMDVFQVGPLLSPTADRLLFAQADPRRSGEWYVIDLAARVDQRWPPACGATK
jgi:Tol biopolymer transport system component